VFGVIELTRLNGIPVVVNAELIKFIEATPDTLVSLTSGEKIMVREPVGLVRERVLEYRHQIADSSETG
jgi:flagellar protein FlbD